MIQTKVIFRYWQEEVIAIFPEEIGDPNHSTCNSYMTIGQHGACNPSVIIHNSRPATTEEHRCLENELTIYCGYNLKIVRRHRQSHVQKRKNRLKTFAENN